VDGSLTLHCYPIRSLRGVAAADFGKLIVDETDKWAKVVKFSGAKPD